MLVRSNLPPLWNLPGAFTGVLLLGSAAWLQSSPRKIARLLMIVGVGHVAMIVLAPSYAFYRNSAGYPEHRNILRDVASNVDTRYRQLGRGPIRAVSGDLDLALGVSFYSVDRPIYARMLPGEDNWELPDPEVMQRGWVGVCLAEDRRCTGWLETIQAHVSGSALQRFEATATLLGRAGASAGIAMLSVPGPKP